VSFAKFLDDYSATHAEGTVETATGYVRADLLPFFGSFDRFTTLTYSDYMIKRIKEVARPTLRKELSLLRQFRAWCVMHGAKGLDEVPSLPKAGHEGKRAKNARRRTGTALSPAEIASILMAMPERSRRTGEFVRPFFELLWETGLRPYATVASLTAPLHYRKGSPLLFISREIDKAKYERSVPLTDRAREVLDRVAPKIGRLFPNANKDAMRESLASAVRIAGITTPFSVYDFRHSRISYLANSGAPLSGVARLVGHKHVSTTALYVHANMTAAEAALAAVAPTSKEARHGS
jgi:integrase